MSETVDTSQLNALLEALAKAQAEFKTAVFDKKSNYGPYASLKSVQDASLPALNKHGLSMLQPVSLGADGRFILNTILGHSSGQMMKTSFPLLIDRQNMHGLGSALTYARRYAYSAMVGVVSDDDDDGAAAVSNQRPPPPKQSSRPTPTSLPPAKKTGPPKNQVPANEAELRDLWDLMDARGVSDKEVQYIVKEGYGIQGSHLPQHVVLDLRALMAEEGSNGATLMAEAIKMQRQKAAGDLVDPLTKALGDPADYVFPEGFGGASGKRLGSLDEDLVKKILSWADDELKKVPPPKNVSELFKARSEIVSFLKSVEAL